VNVAGDAFELHITHYLLDVNQTALRVDLKLCFFRNDERKILFELGGRRGGIENGGGYVNAVIGLFGFDRDLVGKLRTGDNYFLALGGLHFNATVGDVLNGDDRAPFYREMFFEFLACAKCGGGQEKHTSADYRKQSAV